jgi:AraC-like DNA-binding protein
MKRAVATFREIHFHNPRLSRVGIEVLTLEELRARAAATLRAPQRVDFHLLLLIEARHGKHVVDFVEHDLRPGSVVLVRPGQVQQWRMHESLQGQLVLISSDALMPSIARAAIDMKLLALDEWPAAASVSRGLFREALGDVGRMRTDIERFEGSEVEAAIIRHALLALLLRLARELRASDAGAAATKAAEIYRLFARELEAGFQKRLSVLDYAKRVGYSESTLSRACVATVGHTAKDAIDRRVALEAKRLLVHSRATVDQIGHQLGFTESTNFVKFFRRLAGTTPLVFRSDAGLA